MSLFVISAPSGTGKSTVAHRLVDGDPLMDFSVSFTTRPRREGETDGEDYHFVDPERFDALAAEGAFLEWANVFGQRYGTGIDATRRALEGGRSVLLDIDVQGARQVRESPMRAVTIMLLPPDYATLERRLRGRGSEAAGALAGRLARARREAEDYREFDYVVINDRLDETVARVRAIVMAERQRPQSIAGKLEKILATFPQE